MEQDSKHTSKAATNYHYVEGMWQYYRQRLHAQWSVNTAALVASLYVEMEHIAYAQR